MKVIFLNTFCGKISDKLFNFFKQHNDVDVFCLQEVYKNSLGKDMVWGTENSNFKLFEDLEDNLPDYQGFFRPHLSDWWGLGLFVKKGVQIREEGEEFVFESIGYNKEREDLGYTAKNLQYLSLTYKNKLITIYNFHGLWNNQGKFDTAERLNQSKNIVDFIKRQNTSFILGGDFNLLPTTTSWLNIKEKLSCRELVTENDIKSTRTSLYTKENRYADYIFISKDIEVKSFAVLPDEVSDHSPLLVEV